MVIATVVCFSLIVSAATQSLPVIEPSFETNQCDTVLDLQLAELTDDIIAAQKEFDLTHRLSKYLGNFEAGNFENPALVLQKFSHTADLLDQACRHKSQSSSDNDTHLYPSWSSEQQEKKVQVVNFMLEHLQAQFDLPGYQRIIKDVFREEGHEMRFQQSLDRINSALPHCDYNPGVTKSGVASTGGGVAFPGGGFRLNFGFNLQKWLGDKMLAMTQASQSSSASSSMMAMMTVMTVISVVQTVVGIVVDIVPPMIPPPFWILWSLPCLPMLTGPNCLFSVLYPVSLPDFILGTTTDQQMDGVITAFPTLYATKVGKTSDAAYRTCAAAYLGMYCASLFPMCWIPIGVREAMSFPMCIVHCVLTLAACPGFWIDDIKGPCSSVSVPPLCSFSLFLNTRRIAPQFVSYEEGNPYPQDCPVYDPKYDVPETLLTTTVPPTSTSSTYTLDPDFGYTEGSFAGDLGDYANVQEPVYETCNCDHPCFAVGPHSPEVECDDPKIQDCLDECTRTTSPSPKSTSAEYPLNILPLSVLGPSDEQGVGHVIQVHKN